MKNQYKSIIRPIENDRQVKAYHKVNKATNKVESYFHSIHQPLLGFKTKSACIVLGVFMAYGAFLSVGAWFDTHEVKRPSFSLKIDIKCVPFCVEKRTNKIISPVPEKIIIEKPKEQTMLTPDQTIADYIQSKDWDYATAIRIVKSENFYNLTGHFNCNRDGAVNRDGTVDHGLWQINDIHIKSGAITLEDTHDCKKSTDFAYSLYLGRGRTFEAWSAYNNKSYLTHNTIL